MRRKSHRITSWSGLVEYDKVFWARLIPFFHCRVWPCSATLYWVSQLSFQLNLDCEKPGAFCTHFKKAQSWRGEVATSQSMRSVLLTSFSKKLFQANPIAEASFSAARMWIVEQCMAAMDSRSIIFISSICLGYSWREWCSKILLKMTSQQFFAHFVLVLFSIRTRTLVSLS